ncbi:MAG: tRNA 2-thiouridine(34) synthase MnmA [Pseudomonadota bacterium]
MATQGTVIVGLSGGVDSAVSAALLLEQGYAVSGLFMKNWDEDDDTEYCTAKQDLADARRVAKRLGIQLLTANFAAEYWDHVFEDFLAEYKRGGTPNPDVLCNREIKFRYFADYARSLGADYIATGHYARLEAGPNGPELHRAVDDNKDQTYFLQAVAREQFDNVLFPLGDWLKTDVRRKAAAEGLAVHDKRDSTGICFIGERRLKDFLGTYLPPEPGPIIDTSGTRLGDHPGIQFFTVGQRQGLGIGGVRGAAEAPWIVAEKRRETNELVVTQDVATIERHRIIAEETNWLTDEPPAPGQQLDGRIRHRQALSRCTLDTADTARLTVRFEAPQRGVNPGQYLCLYDSSRCLGGARIVGSML